MTRCGLLLGFVLMGSMALFAQDQEQRHALGVHQNFVRYNIGPDNRSQWKSDSSSAQSLRFSYSYNLSKAWKLHAGFSQGLIKQNTVNETPLRNAWVGSLDANLWLNLNNGGVFKAPSRFRPHLTVGYRGDIVPQLEATMIAWSTYGLGAGYAITENIETQYQWSVQQQLGGNFQTNSEHRLGLSFTLGRQRKASVDEDGDGLVGSMDACPGLAGPRRNNGCPDSLFNSPIIDSLSQVVDAQEERIASLRNDSARIQKLQADLVVSGMRADSLAQRLLSADSLAQQVTEKEPVPNSGTYYVITISAITKEGADLWLVDMKKVFPGAEIIPQADGLYRVGVSAGKNLTKASNYIKQAIQNGYETAWILIR